MNCFREFRKPLAVVSAAAFLAVSVPAPVVQAALVSTDRVVSAESSAQARAQVAEFLAREDVRQQMQALGVDPAEAEARVASLTDAEVAQIQGQLESLPAGEGALGVIVGAALIIFLVLVITDILGFTNAFEFTRKGSANPSR